MKTKEAGMDKKVLIYGKPTWPYTKAAREAYANKEIDTRFINVVNDPLQLEKMLTLSKGERKVPVIVEKGKVAIGFQGKGWRI